jgi:hypothetical protein
MAEMPFALQRIQTDRGGEFFAIKFQERHFDSRCFAWPQTTPFHGELLDDIDQTFGRFSMPTQTGLKRLNRNWLDVKPNWWVGVDQKESPIPIQATIETITTCANALSGTRFSVSANCAVQCFEDELAASLRKSTPSEGALGCNADYANLFPACLRRTCGAKAHVRHCVAC